MVQIIIIHRLQIRNDGNKKRDWLSDSKCEKDMTPQKNSNEPRE